MIDAVLRDLLRRAWQVLDVECPNDPITDELLAAQTRAADAYSATLAAVDAALVRDAARYRFLRQDGVWLENDYSGASPCVYDDELDAAVDAAMPAALTACPAP